MPTNPLIDDIKSKQPAQRVKQLEKLVAQQAETIERLRKGKWKRPTIRVPKKSNAGSIRVIIPDSHGSHINWQAAHACLADIARLNPSEVVMLGDHLDCGGWLAKHHVLGFVPETTSSFEEDIGATNQFLDDVQNAAPAAKIYYIEGNHEHRIEKEIIKLTAGHPRDSAMMMRMWGPQAVLHLDKRKIEWIGREKKYNCHRRGMIKLGRMAFMHGKRCGPHAAHNTLRQTKCNTGIGHGHRMLMAIQESAEDSMLGCWMFGCLCEMSPLYYDTDPTDWAHGYGVQAIAKDGTFSTIQSVILDGKSLMANLLELLK